MCPLCFGAATLLVSGTSAGGLAAVLFDQHFRKRRTPSPSGPASAMKPTALDVNSEAAKDRD